MPHHRFRIFAGLALAALTLPAFAAPRWPSLAEQLTADRVRPGTALARFIAAHQDFSALAPNEAADGLPVPAWLRAAWRKAHPESTFPANDPTHGYPHFLREIHEWMLHHQDLKSGPAELDLAPATRATAGGELRISGEQLNPRSESDIAINPGNPQQVLAGSNNLDGFSGRLGIYYSSDGGATWGNTLLPLVGGDDYHGDPAVGWAPDGTAWALALGITGTSLSELHIRAYRSTDGGATWTFDGTPSANHRAADKEKLAIDTSPASPFRGNLYTIYWNNGPSYVARRTAAGWQRPVRVSGNETQGGSIGGDIKVNSAGEVLAAWTSSFNQNVVVARSLDGGATFQQPVVAARSIDTYTIKIPAQDYRDALITLALGVYRTATVNHAYLAWMDLSGEPGCTSVTNAPGANAASPCTTRIWFTRSTDGGTTWSPRVRIHHTATLSDQFHPALAVDESTGKIGLIYYDTVASADRRSVDVYYQSSSDFGLSWSEPLKVTSAPSNETTNGAMLANQYGDYNGLAGFLGRFLPSWTDRRSGGREEIWTAPILDP